MGTLIRKILEKHVFTPVVFQYLEDDIKKILPYIKPLSIEKGKFINFDKSEDVKLPLFFVFEGTCSILYNEHVICEIFPEYLYTVGEISYIRAVKADTNVERLGDVKVVDTLKAVVFDLAFFDIFPTEIKIFIAEKVFQNVTEKIVVSNHILEKYKICNYLIKNFFKITKKSIGLNKLKEEIRNLSKLKKKVETIKKTMNNDFKGAFISDKDAVKKRFLYLKQVIIPSIEPLKLLPDNLIFQIAKKGIWLKYNEGDNIIMQGEASDGTFYIIVNGEVEIMLNNVKINELTGTFMVGEMTLLRYGGLSDNYLRTSTVKAKKDTYAIKVDSKILKAYNSDNKLFFYNSIISQLVKRLKDLNESICKSAEEIESFLKNLRRSEQITEKEFGELKELIFSFSFKNKIRTFTV
jgi:CRP-like cAMP-binding protein